MMLRELRERAGMTQVQLAVKAGLTPSTVYKLESGKAKRPSYTTLRSIASALGVRPDEVDVEITSGQSGEEN